MSGVTKAMKSHPATKAQLRGTLYVNGVKVGVVNDIRYTPGSGFVYSDPPMIFEPVKADPRTPRTAENLLED